MILHLDFETRSAVDLKKCGLSVYAKDRSTDVLCAALAFDGEEPWIWLPGEELPEDVFKYVESGGQVWAHNASFERELCNRVAARKYGWPILYDDQLVCTMAMAYAMGLPGSLDGCSAALGISQRKDMAGSRVMLKLCQPKKRHLDGKFDWWDDPEDLNKLYDYCLQDVRVEREAGNRMLKLSPYEREVWKLDQKINGRGVKIDVTPAFAAIELASQEKLHLNARMREVTGNKVATCQAVAQIKEFLIAQGVQDFDGIAKADVTELLAREQLTPNVREALELRKEAGKASVAKLDPMVFGSDSDHRLRNVHQFCGAHTRRWAGRRVQFQNLKRSAMKAETADLVLGYLSKSGVEREDFAMLFGEPLTVLSNCIRGFLIADAGKEFLCCDFASIEARVLAWLAGQQYTLDLFHTNQDVYVAAASDIFGIPPHLVTKEQRAVGKVAVLALGYGGGAGAFQQMAKGYGVSMAPAFDALWERASHDQRDFVLESYATRGVKLEIPKAEYIASDLTKTFWREKNPAIVQFWRELEAAVIEAVEKPGQVIKQGARGLAFKVSGSFLFARLPGGGCMCYPFPEIKETKTPWGATKALLAYMTENSTTRQWERTTTYGGELSNNLTQAVARDLLADAMLRLEKSGFAIVMHVHDEVLCELPMGQKSIHDMSRIMSQVPQWATGLPISAAGWVGTRYRK